MLFNFKSPKKAIIVTGLFMLFINRVEAAQISNLVNPVSYFINHVNQLNFIKENLGKYSKASIVDTTGLGKTQIARMYAYDNDKYEIIWFIDCSLDLNREFLKLAKAINIQEQKDPINIDSENIRGEILNYLENRTNWYSIIYQ